MSEPLAPFPARLHVLLARDAPVGVVIRRGPSKHVATLLWDRRNDRFDLGQWMKARIYERRSDLSPDGKHLIYFALNGKWDSESKGAWTAISRAPCLDPITLLAKGDGWHGGGLWEDNQTYWLNDGYGHAVIRESPEFRRSTNLRACPGFGVGWDDVYLRRLRSDGWERMHDDDTDRCDSDSVFFKPVGHGWTLRKDVAKGYSRSQGRGCECDEHALVHEDSGTEIPHPDWEWADVDTKHPTWGNRIVWAKGGKLYCGNVDKDGLAGDHVIHDFNAMTPEII